MSTSSLDKELQERLREASAIGDIDEVRTLVESGVNINSQNEINGWYVAEKITFWFEGIHQVLQTLLVAAPLEYTSFTQRNREATKSQLHPRTSKLAG